MKYKEMKRIWVSKDFARDLSVSASMKDKSILQFSHDLSVNGVILSWY